MMAASAPMGSPRRSMALSPGGSSFDAYIYRPETVRRQRKPRRIVHRNIEQVLSETTDEAEEEGGGTPDPIQNVRKAAGYKELVEKCEPGAEIHRYSIIKLCVSYTLDALNRRYLLTLSIFWLFQSSSCRYVP